MSPPPIAILHPRVPWSSAAFAPLRGFGLPAGPVAPSREAPSRGTARLPWVQALLEVLGVAILYAFLGRVSFLVSVSHNIVTPVFFIAEGVALAAAILAGPRIWPGIFLGQLALATSTGLGLLPSLAIAAINSSESVLGAHLFRRWGLEPRLLGVRDLGLLVALVFLVLQPFSATLGTGVLLATGAIDGSAAYLQSWANWWLGNSMGQFLVAPLLLVGFTEPEQLEESLRVSLAPLLLLFAIAWMVFWGSAFSRISMTVVVFTPLLIWIAVRGGLAAVCLGSSGMTLMALFATSRGSGPFANSGSRGIVNMDVFILGLSLTAQFLSVLYAERRRVEAALQRAKEDAESSSRSKSLFLATMSHEIRTPMNGVMGMTHLLLDSPLSEEQRDLARNISLSSELLLTIINDILDFSKIEAGRMDFETRPFSLWGITDRVDRLLAPRAAEKGIGFRIEKGAGVQDCYLGDSTRIHQVLLNLASNAVKFTAEGDVRIVVAGLPGGLRIEVHDTGIGISPAMRDRLFSAFSQVDPSTSRQFGGTGLGLAISKRLVEGMGGEIAVASQEGAGSCFWFTLPLAASTESPGSDAPAAAPDAPLPAPAPRQDLLLVEDNPVNQKLALTLLRRLGFAADLAEDGHQAVAAAERKPYAVILMDLQMPGMDGLEAARRIRVGLGPNAKTAIIALTANALQSDREACFQAGMNDFISKPFSKDQIAACIHRWLGEGGEAAGRAGPPLTAPGLDGGTLLPAS